MEDRHRKAIKKNYISLVEQTDLEQMVIMLHQKGVFSDMMIERYMDRGQDQRTRKRMLYMDVQRRGPHAFGHLIEALTECGYWDIVRDLDPQSSLHPRSRRPINDSNEGFVSLRNTTARRKNEQLTSNMAKIEPSTSSAVQELPSRVKPPMENVTDSNNEIPRFNVNKSKEFIEEGNGLGQYRTRSRRRGVLIVFSYTWFAQRSDAPRRGVDVDCKKLKYLFDEIGFKVLAYPNLTKKQTLETLQFLKQVLMDTESVFVVVSSHGYKSPGTSDTDFRCSDGLLISLYDVIEHFNNRNFPELYKIPKVFIFQLCRGSNDDADWVAPPHMKMPNRAPTDGTVFEEMAGDEHVMPAASGDAPPDNLHKMRLYSDILIAHSTLPGFVSHRCETEGSWYIQALCEVFAEHAHGCHVETLFSMVDERLHEKFSAQTSSVDKWGFNKLLYLHPGLFED